MSYSIAFFLSSACLVLAVFLACLLVKQRYKRKTFINAFYCFVGLFAIAEVFLFYPLLAKDAPRDVPGVFAFFASVHQVIRLFVVDCDINDIIASIRCQVFGQEPAWLFYAYASLATLFYIASPVLAAGAVVSVFANLSSYCKFLFGRGKDVYIFSDLNENSLALANNLKAADPKRMIVFTDVFPQNDESTYELINQAKKIGPIMFKKDITLVNFRIHSKSTKMYFFIMGPNEEENLNQAVVLCSKGKPPRAERKKDKKLQKTYGYDFPRRGDTRLYFFTEHFSSEVQFSTIQTDHIRLRRVNTVQSLVYKLLDDNGMQIFDSAVETENTVENTVTGKPDKEKKISAFVIGMGRHGTEMVKALTWFAQVHPYRLEITATDMRPNAADIFKSNYPELFDCNPAEPPLDPTQKYHNGDFTTPGEAHYQISIHSGIDTDVSAFDEILKKVRDTSYIFVAMGDDDMNIKTAIRVRIMTARMGYNPVIHAVIYNPHKTSIFPTRYDEEKGYTVAAEGNRYNIIPFGDMDKTYSEECVLNSQLEGEALARHMKYTYRMILQNGFEGKKKEEETRRGEESFWSSDYNYRSSIASVIHSKFKRLCNTPGSRKAPADRTSTEKYFHANMEHRRWNAYVRSEGYVWGEKKNHLIKTHPLLVPFDQLPLEEQLKDDD